MKPLTCLKLSSPCKSSKYWTKVKKMICQSAIQLLVLGQFRVLDESLKHKKENTGNVSAYPALNSQGWARLRMTSDGCENKPTFPFSTFAFLTS